ncbi:aldolase catalytic domain-containing protein [Chloroflexota bacterium]
MKTNNPEENPLEKRISCHPDIKLLDCTIRDGGLMNEHYFDDEIVTAVYSACVDAGINYMEIGYINSRQQFSPAEHGPWKFSTESDIRRIVGDNDTPLKLSAMADAEKCDYREDILPSSQSVLDMIRVAAYIHQLPVTLDMIKDAHDKGYETCVNMMAISTATERELDNTLELLAKSEAETIYISDSFGAFYSEQVRLLVDKYTGYAKEAGKQVGMHAHNNQQLAFANTVEAIAKGVNIVDASMAGLGRGAGNCQMELLVGFLHDSKYQLRPVLECVQNHIEPLREHLVWGYDPSYMMTGILNQHPRSAMGFNSSEDRGDLVKFYDQIASTVSTAWA